MTEFRKVIQDLIDLFGTLIPVEEEKLHAVAANDIVAVEDCMNREQAAILRLKGLDRKREELQKKLGFEAKSFQQILETVSPEERSELEPLFDELGTRIKNFQDVNEDANTILKSALRRIELQMGKAGTGYPNAKQNSNGSHTFTSRKL